MQDTSPPSFLDASATATLWQALERSWSGVQDSAHDLAHITRVRASALAIFAQEGSTGNGAALEAAAILHDLVPIEKNDSRRAMASRLSAQAAAPLLRSVGLDGATVAAAQHAIEAHSWSAGITPSTIEARILRDADRLDAMGAIGVARCISIAGRLGQSLYHPTDPYALHRPLNDTLYCHDHFLVKLYGLADGLLTASAQEEGQRRLVVMQTFWHDLFHDAGIVQDGG